jgi:murein DD-endopeptidase MepM/ murein hydrolase activator NlpD
VPLRALNAQSDNDNLDDPSLQNSQTMALLHASNNKNVGISRKDLNSPLLADDQAILHNNQILSQKTEKNKAQTEEDEYIVPGTNDQISIYVVKQGDSLPQIAKMFGVTTNTIRWANDLSNNSSISNGQQLVILPISGVKYKVKEGDTLKKIVSKFGGNTEEIISFNGLEGRADVNPGDEIIIPNGEVEAVVTPKANSGSKNTKNLASKAKKPATSSMVRPVVGGTRTQGVHGHNGIDIAAPMNTPIIAAAGGQVIIAKGGGGWNGGYGNYVVIKHNNGTQTLYAHLNRVNVKSGAQVSQGDVIGGMGNSGDSSGVHLHFEVRGGRNPF